MQIFKNANYNFMRFKYWAFLLSGIIIVAGIINITVRHGLNFGIDFAGGSLIRVMFRDDVPIGDVRSALSAVGLGNSRIQSIAHGQKEYMIRTMQMISGADLAEEIEAHEVMANKVIDALRAESGRTALQEGKKDLNAADEAELTFLLEPSFPGQAQTLARSILGFRVEKGIIHDFDQMRSEAGIDEAVIRTLEEKTFLGRLVVLSKESVGPQIGRHLRQKATQATVWAMIGMLIYIAIRFQFAYGVSAVITLIHDVLVTVGIFSLTNRELNMPVIAAIMTLVGYSLNDTIVIFDRVRDNIKMMRKDAFDQLLNKSINQTLSRTTITSGTTFLTVAALFLFGGEVINDFAFTMMIGIIVGTYSSIYQSCSLLFMWNRLIRPVRAKRK